MKLEIEHGDGEVRTLALTRPLTQGDVLTYRAREARWPDPVVMTLPSDPANAAEWLAENGDVYAAMLDRAAVVYPAQLEWLARFLAPADVQWLEVTVTPAVVAQVCQALLSTREVPAETAKKFKVRPLS